MEKKITIIFIVLIILAAILVGWQSFQPPKVVVDKETTLDKIKERGKLIVGGDVPYGVMEFFDENKNVVGVDVDIVKEIANQLGVELEYKVYDWDSLFEAVKSGEIDLAASSITITPEREKEMLFSISYFNGGQIVLVRKSDDSINSPIDLGGKKVGVQVETTGQYALKKYVEDDLISTYEIIENSVLKEGILYDLKSGRIDAIVIDYIAAVSIVKENNDLFRTAGKPFTQEFYGLPTKLGNYDLMYETNKILRDMKKDGRLKDIDEKWTK